MKKLDIKTKKEYVITPKFLFIVVGIQFLFFSICIGLKLEKITELTLYIFLFICLFLMCMLIAIISFVFAAAFPEKLIILNEVNKYFHNENEISEEEYIEKAFKEENTKKLLNRIGIFY